MSLIEADSLKRITVKDLNKLGLLNSNTPIIETIFSFNNCDSRLGSTLHYKDNELVRMDISYTMKDYAINRNTTVNICTMPCYYGGKKRLFKCPNCNRLCYKIYLYSTDFKCRICHNLTYESNNRKKSWRLLDSYFDLALGYHNDNAIMKALKYPTYKGRYTRNYLKVMNRLEKIDMQEYNNKIERMLKA